MSLRNVLVERFCREARWPSCAWRDERQTALTGVYDTVSVARTIHESLFDKHG